MRSIAIVMLLAGRAAAGSLDLDLGLQATKTSWPGDRGGGAAFAAGYWFRPWIGAVYLGKEQYANVDDRFLSYLSVNAATRYRWLTATLGLVHQHEEPRAAVMEQPISSLFGTGDGIRHRTGVRSGVAFAWSLDVRWRVALEVDATRFTDTDKGPAWMASAGVSLGFTYDFAGAK